MNIIEQQITDLKNQLPQKNAGIAYLYEQFILARQKQFGSSAENFVGQGDLFNEAEVITDESEPEKQTISYTRKKPIRKPLPNNLPREQILHDIADKTCTCCGRELHRIGEVSQRSWSLSQLR